MELYHNENKFTGKKILISKGHSVQWQICPQQIISSQNTSLQMSTFI